jgi:isovaleryl-CoA dehydrogenase
MGALGVMGITVPEEFGGAHMGYLAHIVAMEEISRASASVGLSYGAHSNLCVNQIKRNGTQAQKENYLPKLVSGKHVGVLAMSEPVADTMVVYAKTESYNDDPYASLPPDGAQWASGCRAASEGASSITAQKLDELGVPGSLTAEMVSQNVEMPEIHISGRLNMGSRWAKTAPASFSGVWSRSQKWPATGCRFSAARARSTNIRWAACGAVPGCTTLAMAPAKCAAV